MTDITRIETDELRNDLLMLLADVLLCDEVLKDGHVFSDGTSLVDRRRTSLSIVAKVAKELLNRETDEAHEAVAGIGFEPG